MTKKVPTFNLIIKAELRKIKTEKKKNLSKKKYINIDFIYAQRGHTEKNDTKFF